MPSWAYTAGGNGVGGKRGRGGLRIFRGPASGTRPPRGKLLAGSFHAGNHLIGHPDFARKIWKRVSWPPTTQRSMEALINLGPAPKMPPRAVQHETATDAPAGAAQSQSRGIRFKHWSSGPLANYRVNDPGQHVLNGLHLHILSPNFRGQGATTITRKAWPARSSTRTSTGLRRDLSAG